MNFENDISLSLATSAHAGTSFVPETRGNSERASYAKELTDDLATLTRHATAGGTLEMVGEEFERYRAGYRHRYSAYLSSKSRCMSTMITGGSNFPTRRNNKRNDIAHNRLNELLSFRERALKAIINKLRPDLRPIMAGDSDACEQLRAKIADAEELQARMTMANKAWKKGGEAGMVAIGYTIEQAARVAAHVAQAYSWDKKPFAGYELTNNSANIRRMKKRMEEISAAKAAPTVEHKGAAARFEDDPPANRVRLFFPGKPSEEVRNDLKKSGFRWSPSIGAWQAYRHRHTIAKALELAA